MVLLSHGQNGITAKGREEKQITTVLVVFNLHSMDAVMLAAFTHNLIGAIYHSGHKKMPPKLEAFHAMYSVIEFTLSIL